ncbi:MAG: hypothetical protein NTZ15_08845 [Burkholderiales bacterium]|nr:hypothetical protein [Burkholderiales bacterium]
MQEISGTLAMLGSAAVTRNAAGKSFVRYDTIEIGDHILQKVTTAQSLEDFMSRGLGHPVTLYLAGKNIVGVKLPGGKIYYWSRSMATLVFVLLMGLGFGAAIYGGIASVTNGMAPLIALLVYWGLLYLMFGSEIQHILKVQPVLKRLGGIPLKS